jgi:glyoxylase-like metal-dependent hydrolase (beta-lactamase superfamily II)
MNSYALVCPITRQSILVDPGADPEALLHMLERSQPTGILLTHTHYDHIGALDEMRSVLNAPVMAHAGPHAGDVRLDRILSHGELIRVGGRTLRVYHTPGHTPDAVCFALEGDRRVLVGDAIFEGGPGKTWSPADFQTTLHTLRQVMLAWPDESVCYPGHGPHFQLGDRRADIEAFLARDHGDFYGDATWHMSP